MSFISVKGALDINKALAKFNIDLNKAVDEAVIITALNVQRNAIFSMRKQSKGRAYKKSKNITHIASLPGDAPNVDEGRLISSVRVDHSKGSKVAFVGTDLDYGMFLELEKNRPWLEPAKNAEVSKFSKILKKLITSRIKRAKK